MRLELERSWVCVLIRSERVEMTGRTEGHGVMTSFSSGGKPEPQDDEDEEPRHPGIGRHKF